jgi:ribosomal protein S18 acetylase RimI-like enzyme
LAFYKSLGYSVLKTIPRYYLNSIDALQMGKRLVRAESGVRA